MGVPPVPSPKYIIHNLIFYEEKLICLIYFHVNDQIIILLLFLIMIHNYKWRDIVSHTEFVFKLCMEEFVFKVYVECYRLLCFKL